MIFFPRWRMFHSGIGKKAGMNIYKSEFSPTSASLFDKYYDKLIE
jgi:hypothetical protein